MYGNCALAVGQTKFQVLLEQTVQGGKQTRASRQPGLQCVRRQSSKAEGSGAVVNRVNSKVSLRS